MNAQQVRKRHYRENDSCKQRKGFQIHDARPKWIFDCILSTKSCKQLSPEAEQKGAEARPSKLPGSQERHGTHPCARRRIRGLWAAVGAARKLDEIGTSAGEVEIWLVDRNPYHNIRVRNYEVDLSDVVIPLGDVLDPIGVRHMTAEVQTIDVVKQEVAVATPPRSGVAGLRSTRAGAWQ